MPSIPPGSRVGLVPPPGMTISQGFTGFEDRDNRVALVVVALPAAAFPDIEKSTTPEMLQKQGLTLEAREDVTHPLGKGFLVLGSQQIENVNIRKWIFVVPCRRIHRARDHAGARGCAGGLSRGCDPRCVDERVGTTDRARR